MSVIIESVEKGSPAYRAGLKSGNTLLTINGNEIVDVLDYRFYLAEKQLTLLLHRGPELLTVKDEKGQPLFRMDSLKSGTGTINANGVEFVPGVDDTLVVTLSLPTGTTEEQAKEAIFKVAAKAKVYIEQIEDTVDDQIGDIIAAEKAFLESIEIG